MEENKQKKPVSKGVTVICVIVGILVFCALTGVFNYVSKPKIKVLEEPAMTFGYSSLGYNPRVVVTVQNPNKFTVVVHVTCSVYNEDGAVTDNLSSNYVTLAAGEKTTIIAESYDYYKLYLSFSKNCASFGNVVYDIRRKS